VPLRVGFLVKLARSRSPYVYKEDESMLPLVVKSLASQGLSLLGNAVLSKGKEWVEEKTGVKLQENMSSDDLFKLKKYEMEHEEALARLRHEDDKLSVEIQKEYLKDTQSAREMQVAALNQDDKFAKRFIYYFAIFWSVAAALYIVGITFGNIPADNIRFADTILGFLLGTIVAQIVAFFYGSSRSSQNKDDFIKMLKEKQ